MVHRPELVVLVEEVESRVLKVPLLLLPKLIHGSKEFISRLNRVLSTSRFQQLAASLCVEAKRWKEVLEIFRLGCSVCSVSVNFEETAKLSN